MKRMIMNGSTIGAMVGMAAGLLIGSNMNRDTRKKIRKAGMRMKNTAEDMYDNMSDYMR